MTLDEVQFALYNYLLYEDAATKVSAIAQDPPVWAWTLLISGFVLLAATVFINMTFKPAKPSLIRNVLLGVNLGAVCLLGLSLMYQEDPLQVHEISRISAQINQMPEQYNQNLLRRSPATSNAFYFQLFVSMYEDKIDLEKTKTINKIKTLKAQDPSNFELLRAQVIANAHAKKDLGIEDPVSQLIAKHFKAPLQI